jgi:hypothetical protein
MTTTKTRDATAESLVQLEEHLELPYISGDLRDWSDKLCQILADTSQRIRAAVASQHSKAYDAIIKSQSNLRQQVDKLRSEDPGIVDALDSFAESTNRFASSIDETLLAGQQFQPKREQLIQEGLNLVLRIRRHRAAIDTWMGEALQRDNGVGD